MSGFNVYLQIQNLLDTRNVVGVYRATGNATVGNLTSNANISASYYFGNGSQLTGIGNYSNTNVASYLTSQGITNYSNTNIWCTCSGIW